MCLTLLITIVGIRTYIYTWSWEHNVAITIIEVTLNSVIVIDYIRNLIDAPVKCEFVMSMFCSATSVTLDTVFLTLRLVFRWSLWPLFPSVISCIIFSSSNISTPTASLYFPSPTSHLLLLLAPPKHEALERSHRSASKPRNRHHYRRNGPFRLLLRLFPFQFHPILGLYTNTERDVVEYSILDSLFPLFSCFHAVITLLSPSPPWDMEILPPKRKPGVSPLPIILFQFCSGCLPKSTFPPFLLIGSWADFLRLPRFHATDFGRKSCESGRTPSTWWSWGISKRFCRVWSANWRKDPTIIYRIRSVEVEPREWWVVVLMTQEKVDVNSMQTLCGRYASHVQIINGTPISLISLCKNCFIEILTKRSVHQRVFIRCVFGVYSSVSQLEVSFGSGFDAVISRSRRGFGSWSTRWRRTFSSISPPSVLHRFLLMLTHSRHGEHAI